MNIAFTNLDELYNYLENDINKYKRESELTTVIKQLADKTTDTAIKEKIKWECFSFDFLLQNGRVNPIHSTTKEDGTTIFAYPCHKDFGNEGLLYLKQRATHVKNPYLIARYNQILWNSTRPYKNEQQARNAADAYLEILNTLNKSKKEKREGWDRLEMFKNGFCLSLQTKYKIDEYKIVLQSWLFERGKYPKDLKVFIVKFMLDQAQLKKDDFKECLNLLKRIGSVLNKKDSDFFLTKEVYETGLRVAQKTNSDTKIWNKRIGDTTVRMANHRMDDESRIIPLSFLKEAIPYYKLAGQDKKVNEVEQRYFELKKELKLTKYELPLNDEASDALADYLNTKTDSLMKCTPAEIFGYLLSGEDIFPKKAWLVERAKNRSNSFMDFAVTM